MSHKVLILDDQLRSGQATQRMIHFWDPNADVTIARSVCEAKQRLQACDNVAYIIVDLLLEPSPPDEQGKALIAWVQDNDDHRLRSTPMLILSAFPEMIKDLRRSVKRKVKIATRTTDLESIHAALKPFIEQARSTCKQ